MRSAASSSASASAASPSFDSATPSCTRAMPNSASRSIALLAIACACGASTSWLNAVAAWQKHSAATGSRIGPRRSRGGAARAAACHADAAVTQRERHTASSSALPEPAAECRSSAVESSCSQFSAPATGDGAAFFFAPFFVEPPIVCSGADRRAARRRGELAMMAPARSKELRMGLQRAHLSPCPDQRAYAHGRRVK